MTEPDGAVLTRAATGDEAAFEAFVDRHGPAVLRLLAAMTPDRAAAEDAFQETFLAAWRSATSFRGGSARAWILAIARNAARRHHRRRAGEPTAYLSLMDLGRQAGWGSDSGRLARVIEDRDLVRRGFEALDAADREVLTLFDLEGFTAREVADALGIGLTAAKSRIHRARLRFVTQLREIDHV